MRPLELRTDPRGRTWVRRAEPHFYGPAEHSPSGSFLVAIREGHYSNSRKVNGGYLLARGTSEVLSGELERPSCAAVANTGAFVIADSLWTDALKSRLVAFDCSGKPLIDHTFRALVWRVGVSPDGGFAVCETASAKVIRDSNSVALFDLHLGELRWQRPSPAGGAALYTFDPIEWTVTLHTKDGSRHVLPI